MQNYLMNYLAPCLRTYETRLLSYTLLNYDYAHFVGKDNETNFINNIIINNSFRFKYQYQMEARNSKVQLFNYSTIKDQNRNLTKD